MKVKCVNCGKKTSAAEGFCRHCGALNTDTRDYSAHPPQVADRAGTHQPKKNRRSVWKTVVCVSAVLGIVAALVSVFVSLNQSVQHTLPLAPSPAFSRSVAELRQAVERDPRDFQAVAALVEVQCAKGQTTDAIATTRLLYRGQCQDPALFRRAGEALRSTGDKQNAVRLFLCAHTLSGSQADLDLATACGEAADIIPTGPTTQALEFLFAKPMGQISWEEVGEVRYFALYSETVEISLSDPAEAPDYLFRDTVLTLPFDSGTAHIDFLYGLRDLSLYGATQYSNIDLSALTDLHSLHLARATMENLHPFADAPSLTHLHVGGTDIVSLDGLENLPNLNSLSLDNTSIENLSILAGYKNIEHLALCRNEKLAGINSLGLMDHLKTLHVERQDVLDFQFLQKYYAIESLSLIGTGIKDLYFLSQLSTLKSLTLYDNSYLQSVAGIGALEHLESLHLECDWMSDLMEITSLSSLRELQLRSPDHLFMLDGLSQLETLHIYHSDMLDNLAPVAQLQNLRSFSIGSFSGGSYFYSLAPLAQLPNLTYVSLPNAEFYGESAVLFTIPTLQYLDLTGSSAAVGGGLGGLRDIQTLKLSDFQALANVSVTRDGFVSAVDYDEVPADSAAASLAGLQHLERLDYASTDLTDLSFAAALPAIRSMDLSNNYIIDLAPLAQASSLRYVDLSDNPVRDWSPAEGWAGIQVVR